MKAKVQLNYFNADSWFSFWHPAKHAAQKSADSLNDKILQANAEQDRLEAETSETLTKLDNIKIILALIIITIAIIYS